MYLVPVVFRVKSGLQRDPWKGFCAACAGLILLSGALSRQAMAQDITDRAGTAEFQYVDILVFARPAGLAGAYTSLAQGEDAIGFNPAGLSRQESGRTVAGTFRYHFLDVASGNATYSFPGAGGVRYAFSAAYVNYGRMEQLDEDGKRAGDDLLPASFNPSLTASAKLSDRVRVGATVKALSEYLGDFHGSNLGLGWGVDAGLLYQPAARNLGFGLSLLNVGTQMASQVEGGETGGLLPMSLKGGFYYHPLDLPKGRVTVDVELPWHDAPLLLGGIEYAYSPGLILRAGTRANLPELQYYLAKATDQRPGYFEGGNALKAAGGLTFQADGVGVDYAAQYWLGLSWVHALTVRYAVL